MAGQKFLTQASGIITEVIATQAGGSGAENKIPSLDAAGRIAVTMLPTGVGPETDTITASENLAAGDFVNIHVSSGTKVRKADASVAGKEAHGFVLAAVSSAASATVYFEGFNDQVTSQTAGPVYLSASTPGLATSTPPSATGNVVQRVGFAVSATKINFEGSIPIVLA